MDRETWAREYRRLLTAYNRTSNAEQIGVYYAALSGTPTVCVVEAVTSAIRESKTWPTVADLVERARLARPDHTAPASICTVCHGNRFTQHHCAGVSAPDGASKPMPVERSQYCGRDWVHGDHPYALRCAQCGVSEAVA